MTSLISSGLFEEVLLRPIENGATSLHVITGYASPAMVTRHLNLAKERYKVKVELDILVGMTGRDGLSRTSLSGFKSITRQIPGNVFRCSFATKPTSIHSKVFVWSNEGGPVQAFVGSANYTQVGFGIASKSSQHQEVLVEVDAQEAFEYAVDVATSTIDVNHPDIAQYVGLFDEVRHTNAEDQDVVTSSVAGGTKSVLLPLVQLRREPGQVHNAGAGLNWGHRGNRNRNEAYLPVPMNVQNSKFFPPLGEHFQVVTDDGDSFIATSAQAGGKAIETPNDNSILGKYFRRRLGLQSGAYVQTEDLLRFGSNAVEFTEIEPGLYFLDFRSGLNIAI
jgi:hypothetical protein